MYAINVIIYVVSSNAFRKVYRIFFKDVFAGFSTVWRKGRFFRTSGTPHSEIDLLRTISMEKRKLPIMAFKGFSQVLFINFKTPAAQVSR